MCIFNRLLTICPLGLLLMLGVGCVNQPVVSDQASADAAQSLTLSVGSQIHLRETVLGISGVVVDFLNGVSADRVLTMKEWKPGSSAAFDWKQELKKETDASVAAQKAYMDMYAKSPIGTKVPPAPEQMFETKVESGTLQTDQLVDSQTILLPLFWKNADQTKKKSGLIWLSSKQYHEFIDTRHTKINLGLFDDSISMVTGFTDQIKQLIDRIKQTSDVAPAQKDVLQVEADIEWATYTLDVDGKPTTVRAIRAQNSFARYTILANENNPLILEIVLTPASRGSFNLFSKTGFAQAFWGYQVSSVTTKP